MAKVDTWERISHCKHAMWRNNSDGSLYPDQGDVYRRAAQKRAPKAIAKKPKFFFTQQAKKRNIFKKRSFLISEIESRM